MSREYADYTEEQMTYLDDKDVGPFSDLPLKIELSFRSKKHLKRDVWDNARSHGWLV
jgi:hypothetical protein